MGNAMHADLPIFEELVTDLLCGLSGRFVKARHVEPERKMDHGHCNSVV
jgi:hypothetical protein